MQNNLEIVFRRFLGFLTPQELGRLSQLAAETQDSYLASMIDSLLNMSFDELQRRINSSGDEEDNLTYIGVILWKKKNGLFNFPFQLDYEFYEWDYQLIIHREMILNGYTEIFSKRFWRFGEQISYLEELVSYIDFYEHSGYTDDDYFSYLLSILNVVGTQVGSYIEISKVKKFLAYILNHIHEDSRLNWLQPAPFSILLYDLNLFLEESWNTYEYLVVSRDRTIDDFLAAFLGIKIFGKKAKSLWRDVDLLMKIDSIEFLVQG